MTNKPTQDHNVAIPDISTKLAFENIFLAHERTQLSWVQADLAMLSFGFTIAKAFQYMHDRQGTHAPLIGARGVGILMIIIGLVALASSSVQHRSAIAALRRQCPGLPGSNALRLSVVLAVLSVIALGGAFLRN